LKLSLKVWLLPFYRWYLNGLIKTAASQNHRAQWGCSLRSVQALSARLSSATAYRAYLRRWACAFRWGEACGQRLDHLEADRRVVKAELLDGIAKFGVLTPAEFGTGCVIGLLSYFFSSGAGGWPRCGSEQYAARGWEQQRALGPGCD